MGGIRYGVFCRAISLTPFEEGDMAFREQRDIGQSFLEYAIMLVLIAVIVVAILLIVGDDVRIFVRDLLQTWFPPSP